MSELKSAGKSFEISKWEVWEALEKVKANQGAPGVDGCSIEEFEKDLKNGLYRVWNRMSSGSYFPPRCGRWKYPSRMAGVPEFWGCPPWQIGSPRRWDAAGNPSRNTESKASACGVNFRRPG